MNETYNKPSPIIDTNGHDFAKNTNDSFTLTFACLARSRLHDVFVDLYFTRQSRFLIIYYRNFFFVRFCVFVRSFHEPISASRSYQVFYKNMVHNTFTTVYWIQRWLNESFA